MPLSAFNTTAVEYIWEPTGDTISTLFATQSGKYKVTVLDNVGCIESDSINIFVDLVPDVDLGPDTAICAGSNLILDAGAGNPGTTYAWTPISANTQTVFVASPDTYVVVVTTPANCVVSDTVAIGVSLFPVVELGDDGPVCDSILLDAANPGSTYLWSTMDTTQTISASAAGTYSVAVTNAEGCESRDTISITIDSAPLVSLGPDLVLCAGQPLTLDAGNPGMDYLWSTGDTTQTLDVTTPGRYVVRVTNSSNCTGRDTIEIARSTLAVDLGDDRGLCVGDSLELDAGPAASTYDWSTTETTRFITVSQPGTYSVTVTDTLGCVVSDQLTLTSLAGPDPAITINADTLYLNTPVSMSGTNSATLPATSWSWDFGDGNVINGQNATHVYASTGTFDLCLTVSDGLCANTICEQVEVLLPVNLSDIPGASLSVYPNPATTQLTVALDLPFHATVGLRLMDLRGKVLISQTFGEQASLSETLDLNRLTAGIYVLAVEIEGQTYHVKVRVQ